MNNYQLIINNEHVAKSENAGSLYESRSLFSVLPCPRERYFKVCSLLIILCSLLFAGCRNPLSPLNIASDESGTGTILLTINGQDGPGRTIMPGDWPDNFAEYRLGFAAKTPGNTGFSRTWTSDMGTIDLSAGVWDLTVTAYFTGEMSVGELLPAEKSETKTINVPSDGAVSVNIILHPIEEGRGAFGWNIDLESGIRGAVIEIWSVDQGGYLNDKKVDFINTDVTQSANLSGETTLDTGEYRVVFTLSNTDGEVVKISHALHI